MKNSLNATQANLISCAKTQLHNVVYGHKCENKAWYTEIMKLTSKLTVKNVNKQSVAYLIAKTAGWNDVVVILEYVENTLQTIEKLNSL